MSNSKHIRYIGGGRWATTVLSELVKTFPDVKIDWVCKTNLVTKRKMAQTDSFFKNVTLVDNQNLKHLESPEIVIISSHSSQHCTDFDQYIHTNKKVLIEKPLFPKFSDFEFLTDNRKKNTFLNLEFINAFFLSDFGEETKSIDIKKIDIVWHDPLTEIRPDSEEKFSEIYSSIFTDQLLHVMSILKALGLDSSQFLNIKILNKGSDNSDSVDIEFDGDGIDISVSLSRFSKRRERRLSLNSGEAELIFTATPKFYVRGRFVKEFLCSERLFPIAQTLKHFLLCEETQRNESLSVASLIPDIAFCFRCEEIFVNKTGEWIRSKPILNLDEDDPNSHLAYYFGIFYYRHISGSVHSDSIHFLKGREGVKELMKWGLAEDKTTFDH